MTPGLKNLKKRTPLAIVCFLFAFSFPFFSSLYAQKQANVWHFGTGAALDFNSGIPVQVAGSAIRTIEGCSSLCDSSGQLLFYTNGGGRELFSDPETGHIWNRNHQVMYDMQGVQGGGNSSAQSSVIFKMPGQRNKYYVFTMDEAEYYTGASDSINTLQPQGRGLSWFLVDMTMNGGLGGVSVADQRVHTPSAEGLCAIRHTNGEDYWILINQGTQGIGVYSVTASGVSLHQVFAPTVSYLSNPSFENALCQPGTLGSINCASQWYQGTVNASSDYFVNDGTSTWTQLIPQPVPNGNAVAGFVISPGRNEFIATCMDVPLIVGVPYHLNFKLAGTSYCNSSTDSIWNSAGNFYGPAEITLYGSSNCISGPINTGTADCPAGSGDWTEVGSVTVNANGTWQDVNLSFTPSFTIRSFMLGGPCAVPSGFSPGNGCYPYFFVDQLELMRPPNTSGNIKASPNGLNVAVNELLISFDPQSGYLSNARYFTTEPTISTEFSPNSRYLYSGRNGGISRTDLNAPNLISAQTEISSLPNVVFQLQLAPDGNIYVGDISPINYSIHRIACPNTQNPSFEASVFTYQEANFFLGLPNYPAWLFKDNDSMYVEAGEDTVCFTGSPIVLRAQSSAQNLQWSTGETTPSITVNAPGTYTITAVGACGTGTDRVVVKNCNTADVCDNLIPQNLINLCPGDTVRVPNSIASLANVTQIQWSGGQGTFLPSSQVLQPVYIPTPSELSTGSVRLKVVVQTTDTIESQNRGLISYDHQNEDLVFYISTLDGSIDTVQSNTGSDWTAMGYDPETFLLYGMSNIVRPTALSSIQMQSNAVTPIMNYSGVDFFAGDYDNVHNIFYTIGISNSTIFTSQPEQYLIKVNTGNGNLDTVGALPITCSNNYATAGGGGINGLAYDPGLDVLFGVTEDARLLKIQVNDASYVEVGPTVNNLRGLAYDYDLNRLWGISNTASLYRIDKNTGAVLDSVPCQQNFNFVTSLTYAPGINSTGNSVCTDSVEIFFRSRPFVTLGADTGICPGTSFNIRIPGYNSYQWSNGTQTDSCAVNAGGWYSVQVSNTFGCIGSDSLFVTVRNPNAPGFTLGPDRVQCENGQAFSFSVPSGFAGYNWSDQSTGQSITTSTPGKIWVRVTGECNLSSSDTALVSPNNLPGISLGNDTVLCEPITLDAGTAFTNWLWNDGSSKQTRVTDSSGWYIVRAWDANNCLRTDSVLITIDAKAASEAEIPNVITPNGDGLNETFTWEMGTVKNYLLQVFDRWGKKVFETEQAGVKWNAEGLEQGTYYYLLRYTNTCNGQNKEKNGFVQVLR